MEQVPRASTRLGLSAPKTFGDWAAAVFFSWTALCTITALTVIPPLFAYGFGVSVVQLVTYQEK